MRKTYITTMPDHIGAFLEASECFAELGINITRVSYNKAIDSHMLFIDAEGSEEQLAEADQMLNDIGYMPDPKPEESIVLVEFMLKDVAGTVAKVLRLIRRYRMNISYMSSHEDGSGYQAFKMGLLVEDPEKFSEFLKKAVKICEVRIIEYNLTEKMYDNSVFYQSFVAGLLRVLNIREDQRDKLLVNTNLVMQTLDDIGQSPYKTFEAISRFAELLAEARGEGFKPRISRHRITDRSEIVLIEPPCGSNTAILFSGSEVLFIDCGYALYREEMIPLFRQLVPDFDRIRKRIYITHADLDHCGLLSLFDEVIASSHSKECLQLEYEGKYGYREQNPLHRPYINICKILTEYQPPDPDLVVPYWASPEELSDPLTPIGSLDFGEFHFDVYEGKGGHLKGETVLIDHEHKIAFTGDIYINVHELTPRQAEYNTYAPVLMTSVDTDPKLCAAERKAVLGLLDAGNWQIFGAHGMKKELRV